MIAKKPEFSVIALIALILAVTLAAGCSFTGPAEEPLDYTIYAFPGTEWGMTPDELMDSLDLAEEAVTIEYDYEVAGTPMTITTEYDDVFGAPASVSFYFDGITNDDISFYYLERTIVEYSDDTDIEMVKANMIKEYGEPTLPDAPPMFSGFNSTHSTEGHVSAWISEETAEEYMDEGFINSALGTSMTYGIWQFKEDWQEAGQEELERYRSYPAGILRWADDSYWLHIGKPGKQPGTKGIVFDSPITDLLRAYARTGLTYPVALPENPYLRGIASAAWSRMRNSIFLQQVGEGVTIVDADLTVEQMNQDVRSKELNAELILYRSTYRIKPKHSTTVTDGLIRNGRWLEDAKPDFLLIYHQSPISDEDGNVIQEEKWTVFDNFTYEELVQKYGTAEMIEKYGDMYTAAAMENGHDGFDIYYS